jgi:NAD(P)H-dependent flavin oxidoreductase YrpB (nitropropane dioxygenase family)
MQEYGLEFPFVSAGMGFLALPDLVAAVSNAGRCVCYPTRLAPGLTQNCGGE